MDFKINTLDSVNNPRSVHGIYPYRGKIAALDAEQILSQMPKGSVVLDPFCGSGTIVYEGLRFGLNTIGVDANPIAVTLSKGKTNINKSLQEYDDELESLIQAAQNHQENIDIPGYAQSIFHETTLREISTLAAYYEDMSDYLKACFLGSIALTARGCNHYKWTSSTVGKIMDEKQYMPFYDKLRQKIKKHYYPVDNNSNIYYNDSRLLTTFLPKESIDFVFSSPPYFDCLDYTAYYARIIYDILGYDRIAIRNKLIQTFTDYHDDMKIVLSQLYELLKPDGQVIFVVGDKKIHGQVINGASYFQGISPFKKYKVIERSYKGTSSQVFDSINKTERKEQIIIWEK